MRTLTPEEARAFYDRFGRKQDRQGFYEEPALRELLAHGAFGEAQSVFEFGCGTGRLALELLQHRLAEHAVYRGSDISATMVGLARDRLAPFGGRAIVEPASPPLSFPIADACVDRVVSTYVLDLLSEADTRRFLAEAARTLRPQGLLCLAGSTFGTTPFSRIVMGAWRRVFAMNPSWVGGCRPMDIAQLLKAAGWNVRFRKVVVAWGVASEVVIAG